MSNYPKLEHWRPAQLKAHPDRLRAHDAESLYALRKSLETFGILRPLVVNARTDTLLDGDLTLQAAHELGLETVPVWLVDVPKDAEDMAHLALNNHAGEWLWRRVSEELKRLQAAGQPLGLTGFHESDYGPLTAAEWSPATVGPLDGSDPAQIGLL